MQGSKRLRPDIFDYLSYQNFLKDFVEFRRSENLYSVRVFAKQVGFKSSSFMKMVIDRKRHLSLSTVLRVAEAFELSKRETVYFERLFQFNIAKRFADRDRTYRDLLSYKKSLNVGRTDEAHYEFFSHWAGVAILEILTTKLAQKPIADWAKALNISEREIKENLERLERLGLIKKEGRSWEKNSVALETPIETKSLFVRNYHRQMISKALESVDTVDVEDRDLVGLTLSLKKEQFDEAKKKLFSFLQEMNALYSDERVPDGIFQINFQIFPLAQFTDKIE